MTSADQTNHYLQRINLVIDAICADPAADLSLRVLADIAGFSAFHFHRIFTGIVGEPINQFVARVRLEHAATMLRSSPHVSVLDAALASGYDSASGFSRAFKKHFGLSPRQWDRDAPLQDRKIGKVFDGLPRYTVDSLAEIANVDGFRVRIRELPRQRLAYIRVHDSYSDFQRIVAAYERLIQWYLGRGGTLNQARVYGMSQDDPDVTPLKKCRFDWGVAVPDDWMPPQDISMRDFPACTVATIHIRGDISVEDRALQYLWRYWLPRSRYQPASLPGMEIYRRQPLELGWETFDIDCAIPVVRL